MKTIYSLILTAVLPAMTLACDTCYAPVQAVQVQYRVVQPQIVRETVTVERHELVRDPALTYRSERVLEYQQPAQVVAPVLAAPVYGAAVVKQNVVVQQKVVRQNVVHQNVVRNAVVVQKIQAPSVVQKVEERRGLFGRLRQRTATTVVNP